MIHLKILSAIAKHHISDEWCSDIDYAMEIAEKYSFVRTIAEYGNAVLPLLEKRKYGGKFAKEAIKAARSQAVYYPNFLQKDIVSYEKLTDAEMQVLRLLCADKSNAQISEILNIKIATVKSHISHILQKLGVRRRSEAKTVAQKFNII